MMPGGKDACTYESKQSMHNFETFLHMNVGNKKLQGEQWIKDFCTKFSSNKTNLQLSCLYPFDYKEQ